MTSFTPKYNLAQPDFNQSSWHGLVNDNFASLDAILFAFTGVGNFVGVWTNSTNYTAGQRVLEEETGTIWQAALTHTSAATGTFADDRAANPGNWTSVSSVPTVRGQWTNDTLYSAGEIVYDVNENLFGIANATHTSSSSPNTMRDDIANWDIIADLDSVTVLVNSVNMQTGDVVLDADDIDDATTAHKFASQAQLDTLDSVVTQEEDEWTPVLAFGGSSAGITFASPPVGRYIKTGNQVSAWCSFTLTNNGSGTGAATISGLPYPASNITGLTQSGLVEGNNLSISIPFSSATAKPVCRIAPNASVLQLKQLLNSSTFDMDNSNINNDSTVNIQITYRTG